MGEAKLGLRGDDRRVQGTNAGDGACRGHSFITAMSRVTFDTVWPADSIEFCSHPSATNLFVCGTYKLEQNEGNEEHDEAEGAAWAPQVRRGKCMLFSVDKDSNLYVFVECEGFIDSLAASVVLR